MADKWELITTVWYQFIETNTNNLVFQLQNPESGEAKEYAFSLSTGPNYPNGPWTCLGSKFSVNIRAVNIDPNNSANSCITRQYRKRSYIITLPNGQLSTEGFYYDEEDTPFGLKYNVVYNVTSGSGIFKDAKIIYITSDNDGSKFGKSMGRRVEIYKLKPKQTEEIIPDFSGIWEDTQYLFGNLNGKQIPLDKPIKIKPIIEIKQNGKFVEITVLKYPSEPVPERSSLAGVLDPTYNENLKFMGWKLIIADSTFDNGSWTYYATKMENNVVMEYNNTYKESGFQKGNPTQAPLVGYGTAKRILNYDRNAK